MLEAQELTVLKTMFALVLSALLGPLLAWLVIESGGNYRCLSAVVSLSNFQLNFLSYSD